MTDVDLTSARENMVEQQLRTWEVLNEHILETLDKLGRERFTPKAFRNMAYADMQIPIGHGQVMLEPKVEGRLLQALDPRPDDRVLEIGTGTGFLTACLAKLSHHVTSVDLYPEFTKLAQHNLTEAGISNFHLETADALNGWADDRRYEVIAITGSLPELHRHFHESLTIGGRLFVISGTAPIMEARLITRIANDQWASESLFDTFAPALLGAPVTTHFSL